MNQPVSRHWPGNLSAGTAYPRPGGLSRVLRWLWHLAQFQHPILQFLRQSSGPRTNCASVSRCFAFVGGLRRRHIHRLATLWLVNGILRLLAVGWFMVFGSIFFPFMRGWGGPVVWPFGRAWGLDIFLSKGLFSLGIILGFFGLWHLVLAWGLFERQPWVRVLGLILGYLARLRFRLGTALGIYTLWVLLPEESSREYDRLTPCGLAGRLS